MGVNLGYTASQSTRRSPAMSSVLWKRNMNVHADVRAFYNFTLLTADSTLETKFFLHTSTFTHLTAPSHLITKQSSLVYKSYTSISVYSELTSQWVHIFSLGFFPYIKTPFLQGTNTCLPTYYFLIYFKVLNYKTSVGQYVRHKEVSIHPRSLASGSCPVERTPQLL